MSKFPASTRIVVGQGFKANLLPGYPANPNSPLLESDYDGHELLEITFDDGFHIGDFRAFDYFGDGSFYLLDVPGHAIGHVCGLARTTEDTFLLMGADTCHFAGALRPTAQVPLPETLESKTWGLDASLPSPCPCSIFTDCHPHPSPNTTPYYTASKAAGSAYVDPDIANVSIRSLQAFDADRNVLVCLAHDPGLFDILPLLNQDPDCKANDWKVKGYKEQSRWRFLNELPRNGKPGRPPIVLGWIKDGKPIEKMEAFKERSVL
jgi:glyoxylase-like metal-dependent hydrolase (beta-lactamase superfamily II)